MLAHNESHRDRALRLVGGAFLLALHLGGPRTWWGALLLAAGAFLVITAVVGFCPLRWILKRPSHP
jgi:Inner membrane protein YgaP-like, transmembrane domain